MNLEVIWKVELSPSLGQQELRNVLDKNAVLLGVQLQYGKPTLWYRTIPDAILPEHPCERRFINVVGTGHEIPADSGKYLGTLQFNDGTFVAHYFESTKRLPHQVKRA